MKAALTIDTFDRNGITCLGETYVNSPFKLMNITEDRKGRGLHLMVMSSSPGILDGDEYHISIRVAENCRLQLHTQSYQRLFNMQHGAEQNMDICVEKGASFVYLPHPCVPHEQSIFKAKNTIRLQENSSLIWGEILTCGRKLNGEVFDYAKYHSVTDIYLEDKLIIKENLFMQPSLINPGLLGQMEGFTHQGSMVVIGGVRREESGERRNTEEIGVRSQEEYRERMRDGVYEYLSSIEGISFGVSACQGEGMIVRILGYKAEQLMDIFKHIATMIQ